MRACVRAQCLWPNHANMQSKYKLALTVHREGVLRIQRKSGRICLTGPRWDFCSLHLRFLRTNKQARRSRSSTCPPDVYEKEDHQQRQHHKLLKSVRTRWQEKAALPPTTAEAMEDQKRTMTMTRGRKFMPTCGWSRGSCKKPSPGMRRVAAWRVECVMVMPHHPRLVSSRRCRHWKSIENNPWADPFPLIDMLCQGSIVYVSIFSRNHWLSIQMHCWLGSKKWKLHCPPRSNICF